MKEDAQVKDDAQVRDDPVSRGSMRYAVSALTLALALAVSGCWSGAWGGKSVRAAMMRGAPAGAKMVTLEIVGGRGSFVASEFSIGDLERAHGVYEVRRGRGMNEVYVLCDKSVRVSSFQYVLPEDYEVSIVRVESEEDLID